MLNKSTSRSEHIVQSGVTPYPIGFAFQYNGDGTPQIRVTIGDMVAKENVHYVISKDSLNIELISLEENDNWVGSALVIERDIPFVQESDYQVGRISPEQIEKDFDLSVMRDQVLAGKTDALEEAIQNTRDDMNAKDSQLETTLNSHTSELTTLRGNQVELGNRVSGIESKIPESASASNQLATKEDLANIDLDDFVKKSGDTMTGDLVMSSDKFNTKAKLTTQGATGRTTLKVSAVDNENISASFEFDYAGHLVVRKAGYNGGYIGSKDVPIKFVYAKYLNSADGDSQLGDRERDLIIPSVGGTLARMEDLDDLRAGIATKAEKDLVYTKEQVDAKVSSVYKVKGSVSTESALPTNPSVGDVYNVLDTGANYVWSSEGFWDKLGDVVDLSGYATKDELSDYLPLAGGTLEPNAEIGFVMYAGGTVHKLSVSSVNALATSGGFQCGTLYPQTPKYSDIGDSIYSWRTIYVTKMNNGADLAIPTTGGTIARIEDIDAVVGDISTALTAILGE